MGQHDASLSRWRPRQLFKVYAKNRPSLYVQCKIVLVPRPVHSLPRGPSIKVCTNTHLVCRDYKLGSFVKFVVHWPEWEQAKSWHSPRNRMHFYNRRPFFNEAQRQGHSCLLQTERHHLYNMYTWTQMTSLEGKKKLNVSNFLSFFFFPHSPNVVKWRWLAFKVCL